MKLKCNEETLILFASEIIFLIISVSFSFLFLTFLLIIIRSPVTGVNGIADCNLG